MSEPQHGSEPPGDVDPTVPDPAGMGVSSERTGRVPGTEGEATHGAVDPYPERPTDEDPPPEQSAGGPEVHPDNDLPPHPFDPRTAQPHSHG